MEADEALAAFAQELIRGVISLSAESVPPVSPDPMAPPPARKGAGAVHPHLGRHLITAHKADTISGHAYKHVPRALMPDPKDVKLAEARQQLDAQGVALQNAHDYRQAADELDKHISELHRAGVTLPGTWKPWTPDEHASHARYAEDAITRALEAGNATSRTETYDGNGQVWKPDRAAMHRDIVHQLLEADQRVPSGRRAVIVGGIASGHRDHVAGKAAPDSDYVHVSAHRVKEEMARRGMVPSVAGLSPMEASPLVHDEASHVAGLLSREAVRRGKNVAIHTALADAGTAGAHVAALREAGHNVHVAFAHVHPGKAADHAASRHQSGHESFRRQQSSGARYLPGALVRAADAGGGETVNSAAFQALKPSLGSWEHWDARDGKPRKTESSGGQRHRIPSPEQLIGLTADGAVRLSAILGWLEKGHITLPDACERVRRLQLHRGAQRSAHQVLADDVNGDLPAHDPASFAEVASAYVAGRLTRAQYEHLAAAAGVSQS